MKSLLALVFAVTTLSGCVVAPVAEPRIYVAPAPAAVAQDEVLAGVQIGGPSGAILSLTGSPQPHLPASGPILSECDGHLRDLVLHYEPGAKPVVAPVYCKFLRALESDVRVHVVCRDPAAFDDFRATVGPVPCQVSPILVGHPITTWSRDRWVALGPLQPGGITTLLSPRSEAGNEVWPARAGDASACPCCAARS